MIEYLTAVSLTVIAGACFYLLKNKRFEERVVGHVALATAVALSSIGVFIIFGLNEPLHCHPLIVGVLMAMGTFLCWYDYWLWRNGEQRRHMRHPDRLFQENEGRRSC